MHTCIDIDKKMLIPIYNCGEMYTHTHTHTHCILACFSVRIRAESAGNNHCLYVNSLVSPPTPEQQHSRGTDTGLFRYRHALSDPETRHGPFDL